MRSYYWWCNFTKTLVAPVTSTLTDCDVLNNFYGGGNLGAVGGNVSSILQGETKVHGSAFGAGFSASIPSFPVHDKSTVSYAFVDKSGSIHDGSLDYEKYTSAYGNHQAGDTINYIWCYKKDDVVIPSGVVVPSTASTTNPTFQ